MLFFVLVLFFDFNGNVRKVALAGQLGELVYKAR
jgi:hypothetical protein